MQNVGTAYAVKRAVADGEPIRQNALSPPLPAAVSRLVTSGRGSALSFA